MNQQPYQSASDEIIRQNKAPGNFIRNTTKIGTGLIAGGATVNRILPFLSKYIPSQLAIKGISKVDPRLGKYINSSLSQGHPLDDVMGLLKETFGEEDEESNLNKEDAVKKYNEHKKKGLTEGLQEDLDKTYGKKGKFENVYDELLNALQNGQVSVGDNTKDPILQMAKPYYDKGFIKTPDDMKGFINEYIFSKQGQQQPEQQQQAPQQGQGQQALMQAIQQLQQIRGQSK